MKRKLITLTLSLITTITPLSTLASPHRISSANIESFVHTVNQRGCTIRVEILYFDPVTGHHSQGFMHPQDFQRFATLQSKSPTNLPLQITETRNGNRITPIIKTNKTANSAKLRKTLKN